MTIQQYLIKIDLLQKTENRNAFFDNLDLENFVLKMSSNIAENGFALDSFFQKSVSKSIAINSEIIKQFSNHSGLFFLEEEIGNVCYAESIELRSEYRQSFRLIDVLDYVYAFAHCSLYKETQKIIFPPDADSFWNLVKIGNNIRKTEE
ncbi:type ISP restriction/modification enzyme [Flavobacterium sp. LC2016-01]|uniref:type ISP restriction/modification enzyme n=1 Tax=Flavobacterium sp. LC2016-01 TaxID=2675876 RepID=UPI0012BAA601|nr:type ISP restriction/modification enzyme [Flavobacterium sp. LC2016-01]MTH14181.1 hypothetical protein [Flavobacterium sp. LC2016-01]